MTLWVSGQPTLEQREEFDRKRLKVTIQHLKTDDGSYHVKFSFVVTRCFSKKVMGILTDFERREYFFRSLKKAMEESFKEMEQIAKTRPSNYFLAGSAIMNSIKNGVGYFKIHKIAYSEGYYRWEYTVERRWPSDTTLQVLRDMDKLIYLKFKTFITVNEKVAV